MASPITHTQPERIRPTGRSEPGFVIKGEAECKAIGGGGVRAKRRALKRQEELRNSRKGAKLIRINFGRGENFRRPARKFIINLKTSKPFARERNQLFLPPGPLKTEGQPLDRR